MWIAYLLGKSLEGFVPPLIVCLLLAARAFRNGACNSEPCLF